MHKANQRVLTRYARGILLFSLFLGLSTSYQQNSILGGTSLDNSETDASQGDSIASDRIPIVKKASSNVVTKAKPHHLKQDTTTLTNILKDGQFLAQMNAWNGKALFVKFDSAASPPEFQYYFYHSLYQDTNSNNIQDKVDQGFFNPASTVKVSVAALALEQLNKLGFARSSEYRVAGTSTWYRIDDDIRRTLIVSDNEAANRLILWLGFDYINNSLKYKKLDHLVIDRLMLDRGTLIESPPFEIRSKDKVFRQPAKFVSLKATCHEIDNQPGNCATALDLVGVLSRIVQLEYFSAQENFDLNDSDQEWIQKIMANTPHQEGFDYPDEYCRFLTELGQAFSKKSGKMLSKCGVALFSNTYVDSSFIETDSGQKYYIIFSVTPPKSTSETDIIKWMNGTASFVLSRLTG
jgi:hypothetical protein